MYYVYIIQNENRKLYYGYTYDLRKRFREHNSGKSYSTRGHKWRLIYCEAYADKRDAREREKKLKRYSQSLSHLKRRSGFSLGKN